MSRKLDELHAKIDANHAELIALLAANNRRIGELAPVKKSTKKVAKKVVKKSRAKERF